MAFTIPTQISLNQSDLDFSYVPRHDNNNNNSNTHSQYAAAAANTTISTTQVLVNSADFSRNVSHQMLFPDYLSEYAYGLDSEYSAFTTCPDQDTPLSNTSQALIDSSPSLNSTLSESPKTKPVIALTTTSNINMSLGVKRSPCLTSATAAAAEDIAASTKRVRRRKGSIAEKAAMINPDIRPPLHTIGSRKPLELPELPPGKTKDDLEPEDLAKYKHVHRLLRNRVAALASREKKRLYIDHLEKKVDQLEAELADLRRNAAASTLSVSEVWNKHAEGQTYVAPTDIAFRPVLCSTELSQEDFDRLALASGLFFLLIYLTVSVKYPSFADLSPTVFAPQSLSLQSSSTLSSQIYKALATPPDLSYIHLPSDQHILFRPPGQTWLVSRATVPPQVETGTMLHIIAPTEAANSMPLSPVDDGSGYTDGLVLEDIELVVKTRHSFTM
ncbi:hypothetical protein V1512DRAFT_262606 [Lipomyces arxii]|uniref:uncharacterized protein n=1 Tax=Lipomyces arxii TaxID=56418 RepID=UPI0034CEC0B5